MLCAPLPDSTTVSGLHFYPLRLSAITLDGQPLSVFRLLYAHATPQVKKRAVLDLLGGMRKQGLLYAKSNTPSQASDMLHVMALAQPFSADDLAGLDVAWLLSGRDENGGGGNSVGRGSFAADILRKGERYYLRGVSELSRLRLEAGAPVSRDITRREAQVSVC